MSDESIIEVSSFEEFHNIVSGRRGDKAIFRGVKDADNHLLIPSIGRLTSKQRGEAGFASYERRIFQLFKEMALPYLRNPPSTDLEWLALAQHHGLPTRLLDWTYNPLIAAFFALEKTSECACAIFVYRRIQTIDVTSGIDPFTITKVYKFRPPHFDERIRAQQAVFTLHPNPQEEFKDSERMVRIIIPHAARSSLKRALNRYHIARSYLFPGLDAVAKEIVERKSIEE